LNAVRDFLQFPSDEVDYSNRTVWIWPQRGGVFMSSSSPDSHERVASPALPASKTPGKDATTQVVQPQQPARVAKDMKPGKNVDTWVLEPSILTDEKISFELRHLAEPKRKWTRFKDVVKDIGPPVTGLASLIIAALVFYYGNEINKRQAATQEAQAKTQQSQADTATRELRLKILSEFSKSLAELSASDEKTRTLAAINLGQYEREALPAIKPALGVEEDSIRKGAVTVIVQLFESEAVSREELMKSLLEYFHTRNAYMRMGILECFIQLGRRLSQDEASKVIGLLMNELNPRENCTRTEQVEVLREAGVFLGLWPSLESANLLLGIAKNTTCLRAQIQAVDNLCKVATAVQPERRKAIVADLRALVSGAPKLLTERIGFAVNSIEKMEP